MRKHALALLATLLLTPSVVFAETIVLKDGSIIRGSIATMDEQVVTIDTADMGRVTIKRRTIQSIRDGVEPSADSSIPASGTPSNINVNINNNQTNDQKTNVEQQQESTQTATVDNSEKERVQEPRQWRSGFFGRLGLTFLQVNMSGAPVDNAEWNGKSEAAGVFWDIIGYRSASNWSIVFSASGGNLSKKLSSSRLERSLGGAGVRFDFNILRQSHGLNAVSQWFVGPYVGLQQFTVNDKLKRGDPELGEKADIFKASGTQYAVQAGYEYLVSERNGISFVTHYGESRLGEFSFADNATSVGISESNFSDRTLKLTSAGLALAWTYNFE